MGFGRHHPLIQVGAPASCAARSIPGNSLHNLFKVSPFRCREHQLSRTLPFRQCRLILVEVDRVVAAIWEQAERFAASDDDRDCTRECLALVADTSLSGARVPRELERLTSERGNLTM